MPPNKIMLIRHAEEPTADGSNLGVSECGQANTGDLSVRGWQRAGALVRFFASHPEYPKVNDISQPALIIAAAEDENNGLRCLHTVLPLACTLGLKVETAFKNCQISELVDRLRFGLDAATLVCWPHGELPAIASMLLAGVGANVPTWTDDRFDMVWVLDRKRFTFSWSQAPQLLLPRDSAALM